MKCANFILQIILIYEITVITNSLQQIIPSDASKLNYNPDNYQNILRYYELLNSVNNINPNGLQNAMANLNLNPLSLGQSSGLNNLRGLNNLGTISNQVNPTQLLLLQLLTNMQNNNNLNLNPINSSPINLLSYIPQLNSIKNNKQLSQNLVNENKKSNLRKNPEKEIIFKNKDKNKIIKKIDKKEDENVSDILKDEINQLKMLTKQANSFMEKDDEKNSFEDSEKLQFDNSEDKKIKNNGPLEIGKKKEDENLENLDMNFLQNKSENKEIPFLENIKNKSENKIINNFTEKKFSTLLSKSNPQDNFFPNQSEEENKIEFEEKFNYLLNKLDVVYKITNN